MAFTMNQILIVLKWLYEKTLQKKMLGIKLPVLKIAALGLIIAVALFGIFPDARYIYEKSKDPFSIENFGQKTVAVSRYIRDIVAGVPNPSAELRSQEFKKLKGYPEPGYDALVCQDSGYAVTHTFLFEYDDNKVMSLSNEEPASLFTSVNALLDANKNAIEQYSKNNKDLKLIWEKAFMTEYVIDMFKQFNYLGSDERKTINFNGRTAELYILNISNKNIDTFKEKVSKLSID